MSSVDKIVILSDMTQKPLPNIYSTFDHIPGNYISDFRFSGDRKILAVSENGYLSLAYFRRRVVDRKDQVKLKWTTGDMAYALRLDKHS